MNNEAVRARAQACVTAISAMEGRLKTTQTDVQNLPALARPVVERELNNATGRGFNDWATATARLRTTLSPLAGDADAGQLAAARNQLAEELPRIAKLRGFLERVPERVKSVPAFILKPQQRGALVENIQQQTAGLSSLERDLTDLASLLAAS